jgi:Spy/CpxP family protein refolding chaperone
MRSLRRSALVAALLLAGSVVGVAACSSEAPPEEPAAEEVRRHRHGAVDAVVETALDYAALSNEQRGQILAIRDEVRERRSDRKALAKEMRGTASAIVRSGTTDSDQFDEAIERASAAIEERVEMSSDAVKEIHALLSAAQRAEVAEGLRERIDHRWGKKRRDGHVGLKRIAAELMLSPDQQAKMEAIRDDMLGQSKQLRPSAEELYDLVDAFQGEDFAAALDAFHAEKAPLLREKLARAGDHADAVLGLLETTQREALAEIIEQGPKALAPQAE